MSPEFVAAWEVVFSAVEANRQGFGPDGKPFNTLANLVSPENATRMLRG